jgi:hypothetical protein
MTWLKFAIIRGARQVMTVAELRTAQHLAKLGDRGDWLARRALLETCARICAKSPKTSCLKCDGTGYIHSIRVVRLPGFEPYEADFSARCTCAPALPKREAS